MSILRKAIEKENIYTTRIARLENYLASKELEMIMKQTIEKINYHKL